MKTRMKRYIITLLIAVTVASIGWAQANREVPERNQPSKFAIK